MTDEDWARRSHNLKANHARCVTLALAKNMREYFRDTTYGNVVRVYKYLDAETEFIEYIPSIHSHCKYGCDDSTHREF